MQQLCTNGGALACRIGEMHLHALFLAMNPEFIVCDEPIAALDVSIQAQVVNLLIRLQKEMGLTYLFISHDLSVVRFISDRICVMYLGNVVELADAATVFGDPRHPYTVALLSSIPTTDMESLKKERILLEGSIPSPVKPPDGCKFHTRCWMACDKCRRVPPPLAEIEPGHFVACHFPERKLDENGNYLFEASFPRNTGGAPFCETGRGAGLTVRRTGAGSAVRRSAAPQGRGAQ